MRVYIHRMMYTPQFLHRHAASTNNIKFHVKLGHEATAAIFDVEPTTFGCPLSKAFNWRKTGKFAHVRSDSCHVQMTAMLAVHRVVARRPGGTLECIF